MSFIFLKYNFFWFDIFQDIRLRIDKKEKEILHQLDQSVEDGMKDIDTLYRALSNKASSVTSTYELINNNLIAKDEVRKRLNFQICPSTKLKEEC